MHLRGALEECTVILWIDNCNTHHVNHVFDMFVSWLQPSGNEWKGKHPSTLGYGTAPEK